MPQTNPTEMLREAEDRRLARRLRKARLKEGRPQSKRHPEAAAILERPEESWLQILWSTGPVA